MVYNFLSGVWLKDLMGGGFYVMALYQE